MHTAKKERNISGKVFFVMVLVLLYLVSGVLSFILFGGLDAFSLGGAAMGYVATGEVRAMRLAPAGANSAEDATRYYEDAVAFAQQNGFNTILFEAKNGMAVQWKDKFFPQDETAAAAGYDGLALLTEALAEKEIQLWLEIDPYSTGSWPEGSRAKVAKYAEKNGNAFAAGDEDYEELLVKSLSALPRHYSFGGYVLSGFDMPATSSEQASFGAAFSAMVEKLHTGLANAGRLLPISLAYNAASSRLSTGVAGQLVAAGLCSFLLPTVAAGEGLSQRMAAFEGVGKVVAVQPAEDTSGLFLFTAHTSSAWAGALFGDYASLSANTLELGVITSALTTADRALPAGFSIPQLLAVNYPAQNAKITTEGLYIMGNSDPSQPLYMNDAEIASRAPGGTFGVAVTLAMGDNSFTFTQGGQSLTLQVQRIEPRTGGGSSSDSTSEAPEGQAVRIVSQIASALTEAGNMAAINETLYAGAEFVVANSVKTGNGWAYQMKSGDWVMAYNCQWIDSAAASFTGITATQDEGGEWLDFEGTGTPAAYVAYGNDDGTLALTFYDTALSLPEGFSSTYVSGATVQQEGDAVVLTLQTNNIWGYSLEYHDGHTRLYLKKPPSLSGNAAQPLAGVRVMLDPGHGNTDIGAPGIMGESGGPNEKDLNLATAQAIAYRLRQLGAEVLMTRDDDSFPTLDERLAAQTEFKPDFFISVHHNSTELDKDLNDVMGLEVYYYHPYNKPPSKAFAENLAARVSLATGHTLRKTDWGYFYVTRTTVCPSVLFEFGFVNSPVEFESLTSAENLYATAFSVAEAIIATIPA